MKSRKLRASASAVALSLTLVTFGSSVSAHAASSGSGSTQGIDGKTILIGSSAILSGPYSSLATIATGFSAYMNYVNAKGGINGYKFRIVQRDNAYTAATSVAVARQLVFSDKVFALTVAGTTPTEAVLPMAGQLKVPMLFLGNADLVPKTIPNVFGEEPSFSRFTLHDANFIVNTLHKKTIAYAYEDDSLGRPPLSVLPGYVNSIGGSLVTTVGFPDTATDYSTYAAQLQASGAGAVIVIAGTNSVVGLQKAAAAIGYNPVWLAFFSSVTPVYLTLAGSLAEGTYFENFLETTSSNTPSMNLYKSKINASSWGLLTELGWSNAAMIVEGVGIATKHGRKLTDGSFEAALETLRHTLVGVWPDVTITKSSHSGGTSADVLEVKNGKFVQVAPFTTLP